MTTIVGGRLGKLGDRQFAAKPKRLSLYPLQTPMLVAGVGFGLVALALVDWASATAVFTLFALIGCSWRADMPPIVPACLPFQWIFVSVSYIYHKAVGYYPNA